MGEKEQKVKKNIVSITVIVTVIMMLALACSNPAGTGTGLAVSEDAGTSGRTGTFSGTEGETSGGTEGETGTEGEGTGDGETGTATEYFSENNLLKVTFPYLDGTFDGTFTDDTPLFVCVTNLSSQRIEYATTGELCIKIDVASFDLFNISWPKDPSIWTSAPYYWSYGLNRTYLDPGESCGFYIRGIAPGTTELRIFVEKLHYGVTIPVTYN
jgi:hypothetical protein